MHPIGMIAERCAGPGPVRHSRIRNPLQRYLLLSLDPNLGIFKPAFISGLFFCPDVLSFLFPDSPRIAVLNQLLLTPSHARLRYWSAIVLYLLILVIGSIPGARQDIGDLASGLVLHSCAYAGLTFLLFTGGSGGVAARAVKAVLTIALMGALDEYVQSFFPYRHGAVSDWLVDCGAALLMAGAMALLWSRHPTRPA
jgi:hypothetical protein